MKKAVSPRAAAIVLVAALTVIGFAIWRSTSQPAPLPTPIDGSTQPPPTHPIPGVP